MEHRFSVVQTEVVGIEEEDGMSTCHVAMGLGYNRQEEGQRMAGSGRLEDTLDLRSALLIAVPHLL